MKRKDRLFWSLFICFCAMAVIMLKASGDVDFSKTDRIEDGMIVSFLLLCGIFIRYWIYKNPEEMKRRFKIDEE